MAVAQPQCPAGPVLAVTSLSEAFVSPSRPLQSLRLDHEARQTGLFDLPSELLEVVVFETQLKLQDIAALALTCKRLCSHTVGLGRRLWPQSDHDLAVSFHSRQHFHHGISRTTAVHCAPAGKRPKVESKVCGRVQLQMAACDG